MVRQIDGQIDRLLDSQILYIYQIDKIYKQKDAIYKRKIDRLYTKTNSTFVIKF